MNDEINNRVGKVLVELRKKLGFKDQLDFARDLGIRQGTISNIETGRRRITVDFMQLLSDKYKVNMNIFFNDGEVDYIRTENGKDELKKIKKTLANISKEINKLNLK